MTINVTIEQTLLLNLGCKVYRMTSSNKFTDCIQQHPWKGLFTIGFTRTICVFPEVG